MARQSAVRGGTGTNWLTDPDIPFSRNIILHLLLAVFVVFWIVMAISPTDRIQWLMENLLVVAAFFTLLFTYKAFRFSNLSYLLIFLFLCAHTFAAHYTYQNTPVDQWLKASFQLQRSYFDRVVHFLFGLLLTYPLRELLTRAAGLRNFWSYGIPVMTMLGCSALFENVEMGAALVAGQAGADYVGLQGDVFDTQKDMSLGFTGALLSMITLAIILRKTKHTAPSHS
ncbi:DUF2238 domain-containing protein [Paenibacillus oleatilyticus]|uniref:DUF2238 domain-containing protein n=1 Tax=Paenibacillus oleatilyticus TaxID=2594886 RepID=UPI001C1F6A5F|nr:DUF2238 domain-containing protein [Paenibacillus oleatilyticus]MBU7315413.1 DUF2238 domain-containing protein [Paenibacillus oleatilyticus]